LKKENVFLIKPRAFQPVYPGNIKGYSGFLDVVSSKEVSLFEIPKYACVRKRELWLILKWISAPEIFFFT